MCTLWLTLYQGCKESLVMPWGWCPGCSQRARPAKEPTDPLSVYVVEPHFSPALAYVFIDLRDFEEMSYNRGLSEPLSGYVPLAGLLRRSRLRQDRPLSDGDIWAVYLPQDTSSSCRSITDHSCLKVYHKDPAQAFSHGPRPANGDARVSTQPTPMQVKMNVSIRRPDLLQIES